MTGKRVFGLLLVAGMLLAGTAWAADEVIVTGAPVQVNVQDEISVKSAEPTGDSTSEKVIAKKDVFSVYDETIPESEVAPEADIAPNAETPAAEETVPAEEPTADAVTSTVTDTSPVVDTPSEIDNPQETGTPVGEATAEESTEDATIADPIEPFNRAMFQFNDKLYFWALKPVAKGYNFVVPEPVRVSVRDFFRNVAMPVRFVSSLFQGKVKGAGTELARFTINSTLGLAGFFDVAKSWFDLEPSEEDLGQTLGSYGIGGGMYIVWPILGPSTVRDTIGFAGDSFLDVANYVNPFYIPLSIHAYDRINKTSLDLHTYEDLKEASLEPYTAVRDAFIQNRNALIKK